MKKLILPLLATAVSLSATSHNILIYKDGKMQGNWKTMSKILDDAIIAGIRRYCNC